MEIIRSGMQAHKSAPSQKNTSYKSVDQKDDISSAAHESISVADELRKLAKLKEEGTLTEQEFNQMKQDLIKK